MLLTDMLNDPQFIVIMIFVVVIIIIIAILSEGAQSYKDYLSHKKRALNCMGNEMPLSAIRKDKCAKLAFKGLIKFSKGEYHKAAEFFEKALEGNPCEQNIEFCYNWLAVCYIKLENRRKYKETRMRAAEVLATNDVALCQYADILANEGDFKNAELYYERAIKYNPNCSHAYNVLGMMLFEKGEYEKALKSFDVTLKINPHDVGATYQSAVCCAALGDMEKAESFMTMAVSNDNDNEYEKYKSKIETIRKIKDGDLRERSTSLD